MALLEIDLEERGGVHRFRSLDDVFKFVDRELDAWRWMPERGGDRWNLWPHLTQRLQWLRNEVERVVASGQDLASQGHYFQGVFGRDTESVIHSESDVGRRILDIYEGQGAPAAFAAYGIALRRVGIGSVADIDELRGAIMVSMPALIPTDDVQKRLTQERRNLRDRADRLIDQLEQEAIERRAKYDEEVARGQATAIRWARRRFRRWQRRFAEGVNDADARTEDFETRRKATSDEFETLKRSFLELMRLKAPASYWSDKAEKHRKAEFRAMIRLMIFFPIATGGLALVFWKVGDYLLTHAPSEKATPVFIVASAGLATLAGVTLWVGRLLTKLYLSEHHLRIDAEEREIMTTTYLALTNENAVTDTDRQIVLTALFRSTSDGIVNDDGSVDVSLAALLAKIGMPTK